MRCFTEFWFLAALLVIGAFQMAYGNYESDQYFHQPGYPENPHRYNDVYPYYENPPKTYYYNYPYGGYYNNKFRQQTNARAYYNYKMHKQMEDEYDRYTHGYRHYDDEY